MTVPSDAAQPPRDTYIENGVTTVHAINFTFEDAAEISVTRILPGGAKTALSNPADYTVTGGLGATGSIIKIDGGTDGATIRIDRHTARSQLADYEPGDDFPAESHEEALDKLTRIAQELARDLLSADDIRSLVTAFLTNGAGITLALVNGQLQISSTIDAEFIRDTIAATLVSGAGINVAPDDMLDRIVISSTGVESLPDCVKLSGDAQSNDGAGSPGSELTTENVMDVIAAMLTAGGGIGLVYDDASNTLTITNTSPAGYTDENARDAIGAALRAGTLISIVVDDAGDTITLNCTALDPSYRGLAVLNKGGAFTFDDTYGGRSVNYFGGAAAATLAPDATHALSDGWGTVIRNKGTGPLTLAIGAGVSIEVNGATVAATSISLAIGAVATLNRWGVNDFTLNGPKVTWS